MKFILRLLCGMALSAALVPVVMAEEAKVVSSVSTMSYTFIEITRDSQTQWLAADLIELKPDDRIRFDAGIMMTQFRSNDLQRTFPVMTFVSKVKVLPKE